MKVKGIHVGWLYALMVFVLLVISLPPYKEVAKINAENEVRKYAAIPSMTIEGVKKELYQLEKEMAQPPSENPMDFFPIQNRWLYLQKVTEKYTAEHGRFEDGFIPLELRVFRNASQTMAALKGEYMRKHSGIDFQQAQHGTEEDISYTEISHASVWPFLWSAYLQSILLAMIFFFLRLAHKDLNMIVEFWRVPLYAVIWPVGVFLYPVRVDPRKQLRQAMQFAAYLLSAFMSLSSMGSIAKAENSSVKKKDASAFVIGADYGVELEMLPLTKDHRAAPWYLSPELWWQFKTKYGDFSGFSFVEASEEETTFFTNNAINYTPPIKLLAPFSISHEVGGNLITGGFSQLGGRVNMNKLPYVGDVTGKFFKRFSIGLYSRLAGTRVPNEWLFSWATKKLPFWKGLSISSEGFYRKRKSRFPDFAQPQIWLHHDKFPNIRIGTELQVIGGDVYPRFGFKYTFR